MQMTWLLAPNVNIKPYDARAYMLQLQTSLDLLSNWCRLSRMKFGEKKTELIVFCGAQKERPDYIPLYSQLKLTDFIIRRVDTYTYLGLILDKKLNWNKHAQHALRTARSDTYKLTRIATTTSKPHPPALRALCVGYLRPRCTYGFMFWAHSLTTTEIRKLQSAFLQPLRRCLGLPSTTHQLGLYVEYNTPSMSAFRAHCLLSWYKRVANLPPSHPTFKIYTIERTIPKQTLPENYLAPIKYAPPTRIALYDTYKEIHDKLIDFITTQDPNSHLPTILSTTNINSLTKQQLSLIQMWITHLEWRHTMTFGDTVDHSDETTTRRKPKTITSKDRKKRATIARASKQQLSIAPTSTSSISSQSVSNDSKEPEWKEHKYDSDWESDDDEHKQDNNEHKQLLPSINNNNNQPILSQANIHSHLNAIQGTDEKQHIIIDDDSRPTNVSKHQSSAPLLTSNCKTEPRRSYYLYHTDDPHLITRARLRHNRVNNQPNRSRFPSNADEKLIPPYCTHPTCLAAKLIEDVPHILLHCPRYQTARDTLSTTLKTTYGLTGPLTVGLITESIPYADTALRKQFFTNILLLTATFITSIFINRATDNTLIPLTKQ